MTGLRFTLTTAMLGVLASCSGNSGAGGSFVFGALLPFTGEQAAIGTNVERTLAMALDTVNRAGGIGGMPVSVRTVDSHSDPERGKLDAGKLLAEKSLRVMLGPEEPDLAAALRPELAARSVIDFLPGVATPPRDSAVPGEFHVGPSAPVIAGALAELMHTDGIAKLAIVYEPGSYGEQLSRLASCEFKRASGNDALVVPIAADGSVDDAFRQLIAAPPDAILLIAYPKSGAKVVLNWTVSHVGATRWYLAPPLDVDEFVDNVIPGSLDNAIGISPAKQNYAGAFDTQFDAKWSDFPMTVSYYYYDSAAVLSLALEAANKNGMPLADAVLAVSNPPGEIIGWNDLARGLELVRQGMDINYDGLTGNVDIDADRDVQQSLLRNFWVVSGKIKHSSLPFDYSQFLTTQCANQ
jgi:neutral amino acid transport system substrate-binding protein